MDNNIILTEYIVFDSKPDAVPYHYRLSYRVSLSCLVLKMTCGRSGCSLAKLHLVTVSMYSESEMEKLLRYLEDGQSYITLRFDPTVNKTIDFMLADKIIFQQNNGLFRLTEKGKDYVGSLIQDPTLLENEKLFLKKLSNNLTENIINKVSRTLMG